MSESRHRFCTVPHRYQKCARGFGRESGERSVGDDGGGDGDIDGCGNASGGRRDRKFGGDDVNGDDSLSTKTATAATATTESVSGS